MGKNKLFRLTGFFLFFLASALLCGCDVKEVNNINSRGKNIICFGDSITFGYGAQPGEDYPAVLAQLIDIPVINAGIDGDTTTEALKRIETDVLDRDPLLVIVEFGGNDFLRKVPRDVTVSNIEKMIDLIQKKGAIVALVDISAGMLLKEYCLEFLHIAKEKNAIFVPSILNGIITNPKLKSDFLHPNAQGYVVIARKILRSVKPFLERNARVRGVTIVYRGAEGGS